MSDIDDLRRKVQSLRDQLEEASKSLEAAEIAACQVSVGDVVVNFGGKERRKVTRIGAKYSGSIYLYGLKLKASGDWGSRETYIGIFSEDKGKSTWGWWKE